MKLYVTSDSLEQAMDYFSTLEIDSPEQLGLFFFFKSLSVTSREYTMFKKTGQLNQEEKDYYNNKLHHLGGMFTSKETGNKRTCLFPFSIKAGIEKKNFYNGGSNFKQLLSRINDTLDNTLIDKFLDKNDNGGLKLKRGYLEIVKSAYLKGNKISLSFFSAWVCRFVEFEFQANPSNEDFTRVCIKYTKDLLNLTSEEIEDIFYLDQTETIVYFESPILGSDFRNMLDFKDIPEVVDEENDINLYPIILDDLTVRRYTELNDANPTFQEIKQLLELKKQITLYGVPGIGKSRFIDEIVQNWEASKELSVTKIQFHPSTSYEEFIAGATIENGNVVTKLGIFLQKCLEAKNNPEKDYLFVIDEINRGNIAKIFGETILALDREYTVDLMKSFDIDEEGIDERTINSFNIPDNLYLIATMNSSDRSIAVLDFAIRRRFGFVKLMPNYEVVNEYSDCTQLGISLDKLFRQINMNILRTLQDENLLLGQSYFLPSFVEKNGQNFIWTVNNLKFAFNYFIIPILEEYTYGNTEDLHAIIGGKLANRIYDENEFLEAIQEFFPDVIL